MATSKANGAKYVVIGGSGFLGSNIIQTLVNRGEKNVHNIDLNQPSGSLGVSGVPFQSVDITSVESLKTAFEKIKPDVIFHTASPAATIRSDESLFQKVNVGGTENIISAAQRANVKVIVYTSSASVVFEGKDLVNVDERMPYPEKHFDVYDKTKAEAERLILAANTDEGTEGLKTVALRPAGIFGPHDRQAIPKTIEVLKTGKQNVQIGDNTNLSDWTYVENLSHAHLLASDKLLKGSQSYPRELLASVHLPIRNAGSAQPDTYLERGVPTSDERPDVSGAKDYAREIPNTSSNLTTIDGQSATDIRPVIRNKFDQFFHLVNPEIPSAGNPIPETVSIAEENIKVAGEVFFITNGQPIPFWDFMRGIWREYDPSALDLKKVWKIPKDLGYSMAYVAEWVYWLQGVKEGSFDRYKVGYTTVTRYYNIEKARRALGYEPLFNLEEGLRRSVAWYKENEKQR